MLPLAIADLENRDDIGVIECGNGLSFGIEAFDVGIGCGVEAMSRVGLGTNVIHGPGYFHPPDWPWDSIPDQFTYVERLATKDRTISGQRINEGDRVRLYLDTGCPAERAASCPAERGASDRPYFGKGRHSCLGEEVSTWLWQTLTAELSRVPFVCTIESAMRRKPDWVFVYYSSIVARLDA